MGKVWAEDWVFIFIGKYSECPKNLLGLHIQKKDSFECETRQLQAVSSGLNSIHFNYLFSPLPNKTQ